MEARPLLAALVLAVAFPIPAAADEEPLTIPFSFVNDHCRATLFVVVDEGGCSAEMGGSIVALCDDEGCDVIFSVNALGTRAASTPQPNVAWLRVSWGLDGAADEPYYIENQGGDLCESTLMASQVPCSGAELARATYIAGLGPEGEPCIWVRLDITSRSRLGVPFGSGPALTTHEVRTRGLDDDDPRPAAPGWYACDGPTGPFIERADWVHS